MATIKERISAFLLLACCALTSANALTPLPSAIAKARTQLVWLPAHHSVALEALKALLAPALKKAA